MTTRDKIRAFATQHPTFSSTDLLKKLPISRQAISRLLTQMVKEGILTKTGSTRAAKYSLAKARTPPKLESLHLVKQLRNLEEDVVSQEVERRLGLNRKLSANTLRIFHYAFTEMLNNAIDHSKSKKCEIDVELPPQQITFRIRDHGIGAFENVQKGFKLRTEYEALEHVFKGRQTTAPSAHTGQGIFFTSRIADRFVLSSHAISATRDNKLEDLFVKDIPRLKGTRVEFTISRQSRRSLQDLFNRFSNEKLEFAKNTVHVKLSGETGALSRSEARRLVFGLERFEEIVFDFSGVKEIGQAFADEIFRVYQRNHPKKKITFQGANAAVAFLITRAIRQ